MKWFGLALLLPFVALVDAPAAMAEAASCSALLKKRDAECQTMAERMQSVCKPVEGAGEQTAECRRLGAELAGHCNRNPCRAAPRKSKAKKSKFKKTKTKRPKRPPAKSK
jgi:hypothetical protein